jgi:hypothetical protein
MALVGKGMGPTNPNLVLTNPSATNKQTPPAAEPTTTPNRAKGFLGVLSSSSALKAMLKPNLNKPQTQPPEAQTYIPSTQTSQTSPSYPASSLDKSDPHYLTERTVSDPSSILSGDSEKTLTPNGGLTLHPQGAESNEQDLRFLVGKADDISDTDLSDGSGSGRGTSLKEEEGKLDDIERQYLGRFGM